MAEKDIVEAAKLLAAHLGYSWDRLPDKCGPGFRMVCERLINPNKQSFMDIAADLIASLRARAPEGYRLVPVEFINTVQTVVATFKRDEAQGYHSRDRAYAIEMLEGPVGLAMLSASPEPPSAWQDISTAPKDGRDIIIGYGHGVVAGAFWHEPRQAWFEVGMNPETAEPCEPHGWIPMPPDDTLVIKLWEHFSAGGVDGSRQANDSRDRGRTSLGADQTRRHARPT